MKIYACSIAAIKNENTAYGLKSIYVHIAYAIKANSKQEATGIAHDVMIDTYPQSDDYTNHSLSVAEIPDEWLSE